MKQLYLIRGLPGSGKSTLGKILAGRDGVQFEADDYFTDDQGNYRWFGNRVGEAHKECFEHFLRAVELIIPTIIISNTFTRIGEMQGYIDHAKKQGYSVNVIHMENNFGNIHNVPAESITKMRERWEPL